MTSKHTAIAITMSALFAASAANAALLEAASFKRGQWPVQPHQATVMPSRVPATENPDGLRDSAVPIEGRAASDIRSYPATLHQSSIGLVED